jgi:leader peptidase (prepilin peptidase)/N-methyltransferase
LQNRLTGVACEINTELILLPLVFLLGISIGSFLNVVADRVPAGKSILRPPSHCFNCGHLLTARDLIPIVSYFMIRGKCRYCGHPIPARFMLVELACGLLFMLALIVFGLSWQALTTAVMGCFLSILFITDLEQGTLPQTIIYPGILMALGFAALQPFTGTTPDIKGALIGFAISYSTFLLIWAVPKLFNKKMLGFAEVGMAGLIGASVGYPIILIAFYIAIVAGGLTAAMLLALRIKKLDRHMQFGMFLALAGMISLFYGQDIADALRQLHIL